MKNMKRTLILVGALSLSACTSSAMRIQVDNTVPSSKDLLDAAQNGDDDLVKALII